MRLSAYPVDTILLSSVLVLAIGGVFIFLSASLGLLAGEGASFFDVALNQIMLGLGGGSIACFLIASFPYRYIRPYTLYFFIFALLLTLAVFIPGLGLTLNGATRWIHVGPVTFQPAELLKIAYIVYLGAWLSGVKSKIGDFRFGLLPFSVITILTAGVLLIQPDTDTFFIIAAAGGAMFLASGAKLRDIALIIIVAILALGVLLYTRPYLTDRLTTFIDPGKDPRGSSYQIRQSLLAVGAGQIFGRGFGQSIQKFGKLPEPMSDSIFSVFAEEFGFVGSALLVLTFVTFALRGLWVAARAPDLFGGLLATGIVVVITLQSFLNIAAMLGLVPLSGLPLVFISHGGSALFVTLASVGLLFSISRSVRS